MSRPSSGIWTARWAIVRRGWLARPAMSVETIIGALENNNNKLSLSLFVFLFLDDIMTIDRTNRAFFIFTFDLFSLLNMRTPSLHTKVFDSFVPDHLTIAIPTFKCLYICSLNNKKKTSIINSNNNFSSSAVYDWSSACNPLNPFCKYSKKIIIPITMANQRLNDCYHRSRTDLLCYNFLLEKLIFFYFFNPFCVPSPGLLSDVFGATQAKFITISSHPATYDM